MQDTGFLWKRSRNAGSGPPFQTLIVPSESFMPTRLLTNTENTKGLFTWREGAPANRVTWLEGLKHSPPLHATHLIGTVSGLRELSLERPLSTTNITADQGNFFPSYFSFLHGHGPVLCLRLIFYIDLFRLTVILFGRWHWQMVTTKIFTSRRHVSQFILPQLAEIARLKPFTWQKATPPSRVPRASR